MVATSVHKSIDISELASLIVPVLKRSGQVRICGDFKRTVNPVLQIDKYPIPNIHDLYCNVSGRIILHEWIWVKIICKFLWTKSHRD